MKKLLAMFATTALLCVGLAPPDAHAATPTTSRLPLISPVPPPKSPVITGTYPSRKGVILVTTDSYSGSLPLGVVLGSVAGHAAMVYSSAYVVEAIKDGVVKGDNNWNKVRTKITAVTTNGTSAAQDAAAGDYAYKQIGKPYNWQFSDMGARTKFYCSQLVWAAYLDKVAIDLNTSWWDILGARRIAPTELVSTPKTYTVYTKA